MNSVVFLVVVPLIAAFLSLFTKSVNRLLAYLVAGFNLIFTVFVLYSGKIPFNVAIGGWKAPFGINFVVTPLSIAFLILVNIAAVMALTAIKEEKEYQFYSFFFVLLAATNGMILTGDIFNFFLFVELSTFAIGALVSYNRDRIASGAALKYLIVSSTASFFTLASIGLIYKTLGTLNFADISVKLQDLNPATLTLVLVLFLGGMLVELKIFPFNMWAPKAYEGARTSVNLFLHGMLGTAGVYAGIRILLMVFGNDGVIVGGDKNISALLMIFAVATVIIGEVGALNEKKLKKVLAFSTTAQMGMILFGISLGSETALKGTLFIAISNFLSKFVLFLVAGEFERASASSEYSGMKGLGRKHPALGIAFTAASLSLMGIPFFAGFWGKLSIIGSSIEKGGYLITGVVIILLASVIEGVYFLRIAHNFFAEGENEKNSISKLAYVVPVILGILIFVIGVYPGPVEKIISSITEEVLDKTANYINIILSSR